MSMLSEQTKHLRELSDTVRMNAYSFESLSQSLKEAADTIEILSAKLAANGDGWIPYSYKLPTENGKYWITYLWGSKEFVEISKFENGKFEFSVNVKTDVIAWEPCILPEPYHP